MKMVAALVGLLMITGSLTAELSVANIEKMVEDIKAKRTSKMRDDTNISSPFITVKTENNDTVRTLVPAEKERRSFVLGGVMNGSAFINNEWHTVGEKVGSFVVEKIAPDHVVLKHDKRTIMLFFRKTKNLLKISEE